MQKNLYGGFSVRRGFPIYPNIMSDYVMHILIWNSYDDQVLLMTKTMWNECQLILYLIHELLLYLTYFLEKCLVDFVWVTSTVFLLSIHQIFIGHFTISTHVTIFLSCTGHTECIKYLKNMSWLKELSLHHQHATRFYVLASVIFGLRPI